ncbi:hypothetical protein B1J93_16645 [Leptospira kirschneri serovar Pomona]|uniref:Uncharacterized protein n=1 Tax=Leptospira kirschneri serovar Pomona TaxID=561005 RepID=A0A1T1DI49_9LEPT|nr:hypothetical protein [Leptospira kirschneri]OOV40380.1 hypothetical protein B1J93_16645 [Leptospira kirschneri serovar Pomona]
MEEQQKAFDDFQYEYNCIRPHEALKNAFPKSYYKESVKTFPSVLPEAYYPTNVVVSSRPTDSSAIVRTQNMREMIDWFHFFTQNLCFLNVKSYESILL